MRFVSVKDVNVMPGVIPTTTFEGKFQSIAQYELDSRIGSELMADDPQDGFVFFQDCNAFYARIRQKAAHDTAKTQAID